MTESLVSLMSFLRSVFFLSISYLVVSQFVLFSDRSTGLEVEECPGRENFFCREQQVCLISFLVACRIQQLDDDLSSCSSVEYFFFY